MRALLYHHTNRGEQALTKHLSQGLRREDDEFKILPKEDFHPEQLEGVDVVFTGRVVTSGYIMEACAARGINFIYFDKGYFHRGWKTDDPDIYYRFSINSFQPLSYFQAIPRPADRWNKLGIRLKPRTRGERILITGCSQKFSNLHGFSNEDFIRNTVERLKKFTKRPIVYRPKSSDRHAAPVSGALFSHHQCKIEEELKNAHAVVTFSSNTAADALIAGVPAFVLGPSIARPLSNTDLSQIENACFPSDKERLQWCHDLAYCQWRVGEMEDGSLWRELKRLFFSLNLRMPKDQTLSGVLG